jgi:hypothetical protein
MSNRAPVCSVYYTEPYSSDRRATADVSISLQRRDTSRPFFVALRSIIQLTRFLHPHLPGGNPPMSQKTFSLVASVVFLLFGLMHALRLFFG